MMKLLLCALLAIASANENVEPSGQSVVINSVIYEKKILKTGVNSPYQFAIDYNTNTLFFSYSANNEDGEYFESVYVSLKDNSSGIIGGVSGGFAHAVDENKQIVYIGGRDAIYKFDYETKRAVNLKITDDSIWQMFYKDGLYFTTYPDEKAFVYKDGVVKPVPELDGKKVLLVAKDNKDRIIYYHAGELYIIQNGVANKIGDYQLNALNADIYGNIHFSTPMAIYRLEEDLKVTEIISLPSIYGFAIKSDFSIVYGDDDKIISLDSTGRKSIQTYNVVSN